MKKLFHSLLLLGICCAAKAQNIDSFLAIPQSLKLEISNPQPRVGEAFDVYIDPEHIKANIFRSLLGKLHAADEDMSYYNNRDLNMHVKATRKGNMQIGPLDFYVNQTHYTTNKIDVEIVEPLPATDKGLWFRTARTSDSTFSLIIEQRIPAKEKITKKDDITTSYTTEAETEDHIDLIQDPDSKGLESGSGITNTSYSSVSILGEEKKYMYIFIVKAYTITDKKAKIVFTKDMFKNFPEGYVFKNIVVQ